MVIVQTPFQVSSTGGGTDLQTRYRRVPFQLGPKATRTIYYQE